MSLHSSARISRAPYLYSQTNILSAENNNELISLAGTIKDID